MARGCWIGTVLLLAMIDPVLAQTGAPEPRLHSEMRKVKDTTRLVAPWNLTVDQIEDREIFDPSGVRVAEVNSVLEDAGGSVRAVVVQLGDFYGTGDTEVIVSLDRLTPDGRRLTTSLTQEELSRQPAWPQK